MIKNDLQREVTLKRISQFERNLTLAEADNNPDTHPKLRQIRIDSYRSQLVTFRQELAEYDMLKAGGPISFHFSDLTELPRLLIKARIAAGVSEAELAQRLGLSEAKLRKLEDQGYPTADLDELYAVARALNLKLSADFVFANQPQPEPALPA